MESNKQCIDKAMKTEPAKRIARLAGLLYFIMAISGAYGIIYVPSQIVVRGEATATAGKILTNQFLFRSGIFSNLICQTVFIFLVLSLYRLLKHINPRQAKLMVALVLVAVPIAFFIIFNQIFALLILKENFEAGFELAFKNNLAMASVAMFEYGNRVIGIFWGLWLIPFGLLVYKSNFIPKALGILLIIGGIAYVLDASTFVIVPQFQQLTNTMVTIFSSIAELSIMLWLLIKGVQPKFEKTLV